MNFLRPIKYLWWRIRYKAREKGKIYDDLQYLISLQDLKMKVSPVCPFCGGKMSFRFSHLVGANPIRDDMIYKCTKCFHTTHFGIPLTRKEYEADFKLRGGNYLMNPTVREDERHKQEVIERLKALGYLEM